MSTLIMSCKPACQRTNTSQSHHRGFTLLEVMVALAIIAIGLAAAIRVSTVNSANAIHLRDKTLAYYVAANKATEMQLEQQWPATGTQQGRAEMGWREWQWRMYISETPDKRIRRVDIEVGANKESNLAVLSIFLPQPHKAQP